MSNDITTTPDAGELAKRDEELAANALAGIQKEDLQLPVIKVTQQLSREVTDGDAESGHFVNTLTGEDLGDNIELVVCHYFRGRFYAPREGEFEGRTFVAGGDTAPSTWPAEYAGQKFVDIPDAEETYRERVNAGDIEWGRGPKITTTHNYIGYLLDDPGIPVRVSLMRTSAPAARKINTLISFGNRSPWNAAIKLETELRQDKQQRPFYVVKATQGRQTSADEISAAQTLALEAQNASFQLTGDEQLADSKTPKAKTPAGGIDV